MSQYKTTWSAPNYLIPKRFWRITLASAFIVYLIIGIGSVEVNWMRAYEGLDRGAKFVQGFLQPDLTRQTSRTRPTPWEYR